jgi:hypothetical protein
MILNSDFQHVFVLMFIENEKKHFFFHHSSTFFNVSIHRLALSHVKIVYNSCYNIVLQMPLAFPQSTEQANRSVVVAPRTEAL